MYPIVTTSYRLTPWTYFRVTAQKLLMRILIVVTLPIAICTIASLWDIRMLFLAIIILFLITPFIILHIFYSKLLDKEAHKALAPKHIEFGEDNSIKVVFENLDEEVAPIPDDEITPAQITSREIISKYLVIYHLGGKQPIIIPICAIPTNFDLYKFCNQEESEPWQAQ